MIEYFLQFLPSNTFADVNRYSSCECVRRTRPFRVEKAKLNVAAFSFSQR